MARSGFRSLLTKVKSDDVIEVDAGQIPGLEPNALLSGDTHEARRLLPELRQETARVHEASGPEVPQRPAEVSEEALIQQEETVYFVPL